MSIAVDALKAPTHDTLDEWLNTPRLARCGELFVSVLRRAPVTSLLNG